MQLSFARGSKEKTINDKILYESDFSSTEPVTLADILTVHSKGHILELYFKGYSYIGLLNGENPIMPELLDYVRTASGGTYAASRIALEKGIAMNFNGGFHHAMAKKESGFCYINDVAITIKKLRSEKYLKKVMVIDMDVHHGDGNAMIMGNDDNVSIFDVYQENNFPYKKYPVEYAVALNSKHNGAPVTDSVYMNEIKGLPDAIEREKPDFIIYLAGADPHEGDILGGFRLTKKGLSDRDEYVIETARMKDIPVAVVTAGGYPVNVKDVVDIHTNTAKIVKDYSNN